MTKSGHFLLSIPTLTKCRDGNAKQGKDEGIWQPVKSLSWPTWLCRRLTRLKLPAASGSSSARLQGASRDSVSMVEPVPDMTAPQASQPHLSLTHLPLEARPCWPTMVAAAVTVLTGSRQAARGDPHLPELYSPSSHNQHPCHSDHIRQGLTWEAEVEVVWCRRQVEVQRTTEGGSGHLAIGTGSSQLVDI